jgi:hypothetical protein
MATTQAVEIQRRMPEGLCFVGALKAIRNVRYGAAHEKAGQDVAGLREIVLEVRNGDYTDEKRFSFNATDRESYEITAAERSVRRWDWAEGDLVAVRLKFSGTNEWNGKTYAEYRVLSVVPLGDTPPATDGE